jgi:hypothetical protein
MGAPCGIERGINGFTVEFIKILCYFKGLLGKVKTPAKYCG